jgi:hypothetical protein
MTEPTSFSVNRRNYGHWDICTREGRAFAIRGGPGRYYLRDERKDSVRLIDIQPFKTLGACMTFACDILMYELLVVEGQSPQEIESWNVPHAV